MYPDFSTTLESTFANLDFNFSRSSISLVYFFDPFSNIFGKKLKFDSKNKFKNWKDKKFEKSHTVHELDSMTHT